MSARLENLATAVLQQFVQGVVADKPTAELIMSTEAFGDLEETVGDEDWDKLKDLVDTAQVTMTVEWAGR